MHATDPGRAWHRVLEPIAESIGKKRGYIAGDFPTGLVTVEGVPTAREVRLFHRATGVLIGITFSRPDGTYRFDDLPVAERYDVIARDHTGAFNDVIASNIEPWAPIDRSPSNLSAARGIGPADVSVNLTWDRFDALADAIEVYRSESPFNMASLPAPIASLSGTTSAYKDTAVSIGQNLHYMVASAYPERRYYSPSIIHGVEAGIPLYEAEVLALGPLSYWRLDDANTVAVDATGFHDSPIIGSFSDGPPLRNGALKSMGFGVDAPSAAHVFAGTDARYSGLAAPGKEMTILMWLRMTDLTTLNTAIAYFTNASTGDNNYRFIFANSFHITENNGVSLPSALTVGNTYFIVMRKSAAGMAIFIDGSLAASNPTVWNSNTAGGNGLMFPGVGSWDYYGTRGYMSDVALFEHALTDAQILSLWNAGKLA